jgi:pimeloyl-ACP methyl ester carboxylesterase
VAVRAQVLCMTTSTSLAIPSAVALASSAHAWLDTTLYPFTPRRFQTAHGAMSYLDVGSGPTVLLVHGTPSWSFEWRHVIEDLAKDHRVIAPDHLGFGLSDKPWDAPLMPEDHAARLRALVEHLDLRDVTLVVHDFGGPIGLPLALDAETRVSRVVVLNSWMWSHEGDRNVTRVGRFAASALGRFLYLRLNASPRWIVPAALGKRSSLTKAAHRQYVAPFDRREDRMGPYAMALALCGANASYAALWSKRRALAKLPMTIVWGEKDPAFTKAHLERWIEAFPAARVVRLPEVGHFPAEEAPNAVVDAIRAA